MEGSELVRVFEVGVNTEEDQFARLLIDGDDEFSVPFLDLMNSPNPVGDRWTPPPVYVDRPTLPLPDFVHLWGSGGFVLGPTVSDDLRRLLAISAELLPLDVDGRRLGYVHVVKVLNVVDQANSVWDEGGAANPLAFHVHRFFELPIFRVPEKQRRPDLLYAGIRPVRLQGPRRGRPSHRPHVPRGVELRRRRHPPGVALVARRCRSRTVGRRLG